MKKILLEEKVSKGEENKLLKEVNLEGDEMPKQARKRIYNPITGRYYQIRQRSSTKGPRGSIMGTWSPPKKKKSRK